MSLIVATIVTGRDSFILQARMLDANQAMPEIPDVLLVIATQQAIFFCPGCGVPLHKFYGGSAREALRREELRLGR